VRGGSPRRSCGTQRVPAAKDPFRKPAVNSSAAQPSCGRLACPYRFLSPLLVLLLAVILISSVGCGKKQPTPVEIRTITRELVFAAKNAIADNAEVGIRPESPPVGRSARGQDEHAADHIYITLQVGRSGQEAALAAVEDALNLVAKRHELKRIDRPGAAGLVRFDYRQGERLTHAIHIITPLASLRPVPSRPGAFRGRLAIIIDDLGYDRGPADALFGLPFPLTVSVLPNLPHSSDIAKEAHRRGYQVMLHLPMESANGGGKPEAVELRAGMQPAEVTRLLAGMLDTVPYAAGVNNHQGSLATADEKLMAAIMPALREKNLFFIDSRTTTATVAYDAAIRAGVPAASRKVFLDGTPTVEAVRRQLALAERNARKDGFAIAIGHPHPATLQALQNFLPQLRARGLDLVFVSEVVR